MDKHELEEAFEKLQSGECDFDDFEDFIYKVRGDAKREVE